MHSGVLVLILCAVAAATPLQQYPISTLKDLSETASPRIIDGQPAKAGQFPWQVAVNAFTSSGGYFCGGSLISNKWVLTAGHCVQRVKKFVLYLGAVNRQEASEEGRVDVETSRSIAHPDFNQFTLHNDIALIELPEAVTLSDNIQTIRLPKRDHNLGENVNVTVSGWGRTKDGGPGSRLLNYVQLTSISNEECTKTYGKMIIINSTLCAVGAPHHSTCNGDSGGPLIFTDEDGKPTQTGVVSFVHAKGCASTKPSGYVRPEKYLDWINEVTGLDL